MKKTISILSAMVLPAVCAAAPKAEFPVTRVEVGELAEDAEGRFVLKVRNAGDGSLALRAEGVCCGITLALPQALEAGAEGEVALVLRMKGQVGKLSRLVRIGTNDPARPEVLVRVTGTVKASGETTAEETKETPAPAGGLRVMPQTLVLDEKEKSGVVILRAADRQAFEIVSARIVGGEGKLETRRVTATVWQVKLEGVTLEDDAGWLELETTHPDGANLQIPTNTAEE